MKTQVRRAGPVAVLLLTVATFAAACGNDSKSAGVASTGSPGGKPSAASTSRASALEYSKCMRSHGVPSFPDPDSSGNIQLKASGDLNPNSAQFKSALNACKSLQPAPISSNQASQNREVALKYAKCMRSNGVPGFPDPNAQGGLELKGDQVNPNSPQFQAAQNACKQYQPGGPGAVQKTGNPGAPGAPGGGS